MKKFPDWGIYLIIAGVVMASFPLQEYLSDHFSPKKNYQRGLQEGMENAEYYCNSFSEDYIGSLDYIQKHNPVLYQELMSNEE